MLKNSLLLSSLTILLFFISVNFSFYNIKDNTKTKGESINPNTVTLRGKYLLDYGWKFHLGNAARPESDFGFGHEETFAKAGETSGPAKENFNDSTWRTVNLPHDWAVELDFIHMKDRVLNNHGYKPLGRKFPGTSIGWYRRSFKVPASGKGKRFSVKFDGVFSTVISWEEI